MKKYFKSIGFILALFMITCLYMPTSALAAAETLIGTRGAAGFPVYGRGAAGDLKVAYGQYAITAAVEDGDIFQLCRVPAGAIIVGGWFYAGDMDTGAEALDMDVGWAANGTDAADPDGLLNGGTLTGDAITDLKPEVGISMPLGGVLITAGKKLLAEETVIQIEVNTAATTWADGTVSLIIYYTME